MRYTMLWIGLSVGNVLYQLWSGHNYGHAAKLSFFQGWAIASCALLNYIDGR
jgi:hypothetical protein